VGKHLDALREYIHELQDFKIAKEYCKKHYDADQEEFRDVYLNLLEVGLDCFFRSFDDLILC
jgi:hypothetical protein